MNQPNLLFVFADQWRAQSVGYMGCHDVNTPHMDALAAESINLDHAVSGCPVCSPYRASLLTGQYPCTHGVFINDTPLDPRAVSIGKCFRRAGYQTGYVGKWHVDGLGNGDRAGWIPPERHQGFETWKVLECTHDYNHSAYYEGDSDQKRFWPEYDAISQTDDTIDWLRNRREPERPFCFFLSWGPPHSPYDSAPQRYRESIDPAALELPPNVPPEYEEKARRTLAGYYAHVQALDDCLGRLLAVLDEQGLRDDTIVVLTSDHGDMLGAFGTWDKQQPHEESIRVPFLLRWPGMPGWNPRRDPALLDAPDLMPTLLDLCDLSIPESVQGASFAPLLRGDVASIDRAALLNCPVAFGNWPPSVGGREYRGLRTLRHTYVRSLEGPWLLYDNQTDPWHLENLCDRPETAQLQQRLDAELQSRLDEVGDDFPCAAELCRRWGFEVEPRGMTVTAIHGRPLPNAKAGR